MYSDKRDDIRSYFCSVFQKLQQGAVLEPLEQQLARVITEHPEYHGLLSRVDAATHRNFLPEMGESNPFLHMGLHLTLRDQISTNRPEGIRQVFTHLAAKHGEMEAEHRMIECLGAALWQAQRDQVMPDERAYLKNLQKLN